MYFCVLKMKKKIKLHFYMFFSHFDSHFWCSTSDDGFSSYFWFLWCVSSRLFLFHLILNNKYTQKENKKMFIRISMQFFCTSIFLLLLCVIFFFSWFILFTLKHWRAQRKRRNRSKKKKNVSAHCRSFHSTNDPSFFSLSLSLFNSNCNFVFVCVFCLLLLV